MPCHRKVESHTTNLQVYSSTNKANDKAYHFSDSKAIMEIGKVT